MSSSSRANALASAALASTRLSQTYPAASPIANTLLASSPFNKVARGKGRANDRGTISSNNHQVELLGEDGFNEGDSHLSSREKRLSRAARFGSSHSSEHISLPSSWNSLVNKNIKRGNTQVLRQEYLKSLKGLKAGKVHSVKTIGSREDLHLATIAPKRYAAIYSVLRQVRSRLGPDSELSEVERKFFDTWTPKRIVEYNCGSGEGLLAAKEAFKGVNLNSYIGYNAQTYLLRTALDLYNQSSSTAESTGDPHNTVKASWRSHLHSAEPILGSIKIEEPLTDGVLVISSYSLLLEYSDDHRRKLIRRIIEMNTNAEVLIFIEEATERGFAAIASTREYLLGSDERECQSPNESLHPRVGEWHVVAPCSHDKSCPLLHDFEFAEPPNIPTTRTSNASSPLFHGAALNMTVCSFSAILQRPDYLKLTSQDSRPEETVRYSYLVVKRGPRPSIASRARQESTLVDEFASRSLALRQSAKRTKNGNIDEIRKGTKKSEIQVGEELRNEEGDDERLNPEAVDMNDVLVRDELLKLLPDALKAEMQKGGEVEESIDVDEAMKLAQEMMVKSALIAEESKDEKQELKKAKEQETMLASAFLDQAQFLSSDVTVNDKHELHHDDIEAMRLEAYQWPRLIRSAIKRSGHVTFDTCSHNGSIDRFTVAKSSGKQVYQDARKSSQGDLFPHVPFSDNEEYTVNVKSLVTRVPSASSTIRSSLPAMFAKVRRPPGKEIKKTTSASSAIGPDRVAFITGKQVMQAEGEDRRDHLRQKRKDKTRFESNLRSRTPFPLSSQEQQWPEQDMEDAD